MGFLVVGIMCVLMIFTNDLLETQLMPDINFILKLCELLKAKEEK